MKSKKLKRASVVEIPECGRFMVHIGEESFMAYAGVTERCHIRDKDGKVVFSKRIVRLVEVRI